MPYQDLLLRAMKLVRTKRALVPFVILAVVASCSACQPFHIQLDAAYENVLSRSQIEIDENDGKESADSSSDH